MAKKRDNTDKPGDTPGTETDHVDGQKSENGADQDGQGGEQALSDGVGQTEVKVGTVVEDITKEEVDDLIKKINDGILQIREALLRIHETQGWLKLKCKTFEEMAHKHFKKTRTHLYRMIDAAKVERNLRPVYDVSGVPDSVLRALREVTVELQDGRKEQDRDRQIEFWGLACEEAIRAEGEAAVEWERNAAKKRAAGEKVRKRTVKEEKPVPTAKMIRAIITEKTEKAAGDNSAKAAEGNGGHVESILERVKKDRLGRGEMEDLISRLQALLKTEDKAAGPG